MDSNTNFQAGWTDKVFTERVTSGLVWLPEIGMGHYPVKSEDMPYDETYFKRYQAQADTPIGRELTQARAELVARHYSGPLLDVGIGSGQFVEYRPNTTGFDVNEAGIAWLNEQGKFQDLYAEPVEAASFWDALEHIPDAAAAVAQVKRWVFVSIPVFTGAEHVLVSKHFRKDEHIWYWSTGGFIAWMGNQGFKLREKNTEESRIGREGIGSFAFERFRRAR